MIDRKNSEKFQDKRNLCLIKYNSNFKILWEFVMAASYLVSFFTIPINLATHFIKHDDYLELELVLDFILIGDILVNFVSETMEDIELITHLRDSTFIYLKSFFIVDFLSLVPIFYWEYSLTLYYFKLLRFIRLKRFLNFFKYMDNMLINFFLTDSNH